LAEATGPEGNVVGLDCSESMLRVAQERKELDKRSHLEFVHGDAMELSCEDESFDCVTIGFGLRNVPDYLQVLREMRRVVKPGAKVVCVVTFQPTLIGFRQAYYLYFRFIMPVFGKLFAQSYNEYAWLHESARDFPDQKKLKKLFLEAGFKKVEVKKYTGGVA